ncbi:hypothetical protein L1O03_01090 [Corynebacterium uropygiale]|uniref:Secreted protein n=1 Tax=Corynebacterium uropygiale TaxID=1775911 RepID=A0A9X1QQ98_9CORY|nr:hypothetical protein [Corynebacterium uropygiale]
MMRKFLAGLSIVLTTLSIFPTSGHAEEFSPSRSGNFAPTNKDLDVYSHDSHQRKQELMNDGYSRVNSEEMGNRRIDTYRKVNPQGIAVEYTVPSEAAPNVPSNYIHFEWDWGPRIYMTGQEFWSLGASGTATAVCEYFTHSHKASIACGMGATALWEKITNKAE